MSLAIIHMSLAIILTMFDTVIPRTRQHNKQDDDLSISLTVTGEDDYHITQCGSMQLCDTFIC